MTNALTGTKGGSGVAERIISEMPWHHVYVEPFWGRGTIARKKRPAAVTVGCDLDGDALAHGRHHATMFATCGIQWLKDYFHLRRTPDGYDADTSDATRSLPLGAPACEHFIYLDPPYWGVPPYYHHVLTEAQHRDLCRVFRSLPCPAALSGYHSELYADELDGMRLIEISTTTRRGPATEVVWFNYDQPSWYHDVRYVGKDRRERERINRRRKTWRAGLERTTPRERQAILQACVLSLHPTADAAQICDEVLRRLITTEQPSSTAPTTSTLPLRPQLLLHADPPRGEPSAATPPTPPPHQGGGGAENQGGSVETAC
jgi:hypothetical protein